MRRPANHAASRQPSIPGFVLAMPFYPSKTINIPGVCLAIFVFSIGFFIQCNVLTSNLGLRFLNITDMLVLMTLPVLALLYIRCLTLSIILFYLVPLTMLFVLTTLFADARGDGEFYTTAMTYFYAVYFLFFAYMLFKENLLELFCWGIFAGFIAVTILLFLDTVIHDQLASLGLSFMFDEAGVLELAAKGEVTPLLLRVEKAGGIWPVGNTAGPAFALAGAAAAYVAERHKRPALFAVFLLVYLASFTLTLNRSGVFAVLAIGLYFYVRNFSIKMLLSTYFGFALCALVIAAVLPLGAFDFAEQAFTKRFLEDSNSSNNLHERWETITGGFQVMFQHPVGIGFTARYEELARISRIGTPHNGFMATAYASGLGFCIMSAFALVYVIFRKRKIGFFAYSAIGVIIGYQFEELNFNPVFMAHVGLGLAYTAIDLDFRLFLRNTMMRMLGTADNARNRRERSLISDPPGLRPPVF
ncbi:O-antigen ligase family protein [Agrobacterium salinitolerans]|uniref:O-antigen ligase family protein n=1 Tax=Agrobacterium salinitolerans TaxID=1183413 RepID=UPI0015722ADE|nr:O-antigen ligase family protein [Agrobacterium salinitolerans]NTA38917.1 O-antigen ligase domain-containing protein [Agrobacterium salinitolerans]